MPGREAEVDSGNRANIAPASLEIDRDVSRLDENRLELRRESCDLSEVARDVVEQRELSRMAAARTGIVHESPQAIRLVRGRPLWNASHGAITYASLTEACSAPTP